MISTERLFDIPYWQQKNFPTSKMFVSKINGNWESISTSEFILRAMEVSKGLISLGIQPGDKIAVASSNRVEWNILDIGVQQVGAILVPVYPNISEADYRFIFNDAQVKICFVSNLETLHNQTYTLCPAAQAASQRRQDHFLATIIRRNIPARLCD